MVTVRSGTSITYSPGAPTTEPVVIFDVEGLELAKDDFLSTLLPTFRDLEWDFYDVRREQSELIRRHLASKLPTSSDSKFLEFYRGSISFDDVCRGLPVIRDDVMEEILGISPYRQRTTARLHVRRDNRDWKIERKEKQPISQNVAPTDYRSVERVFPETPSQVIEHPHFISLVKNVATLVSEIQKNIRTLEFISWQTSITATGNRAGSNSPEGIHQDGSDYIVSALVLERNNITGGQSRIFAPDKTTQHVGITLAPGQGILQADRGSTLWHDVTPITVEDSSRGPGTRKIFGFDINVLETA